MNRNDVASSPTGTSAPHRAPRSPPCGLTLKRRDRSPPKTGRIRSPKLTIGSEGRKADHGCQPCPSASRRKTDVWTVPGTRSTARTFSVTVFGLAGSAASSATGSAGEADTTPESVDSISNSEVCEPSDPIAEPSIHQFVKKWIAPSDGAENDAPFDPIANHEDPAGTGSIFPACALS
ncbi:MAG: hypothetical protein HMLKMBBP_00529 [Planctomycetes bacterium]|nr:hypothetical protein [Planctomycetota bacterium]